MEIDKDLLGVIISSVVTLIVGVGGAFFGYRGAVKGAKLQIESAQENERTKLENELKLLERNKKQQADFARKTIENFISIEIKKNFSGLNSTELSSQLTNNPTPFRFIVGYTYDYQEYNNLKYELIRYESDEVKDIISIYDMFYLIERKRDIKDLTQTEYEEFKRVYDICLAKYF